MIRILCCEHFLQKLEQTNISFVKKQDFFCSCEEHLDTFVIQCTFHKMFFERFDHWPGNYKCYAVAAKETCTACLSKMFILNHLVYKVCIPTLSFNILPKMTNLEAYLEKFSSEAFFLF